jgi:hypothetical protein
MLNQFSFNQQTQPLSSQSQSSYGFHGLDPQLMNIGNNLSFHVYQPTNFGLDPQIPTILSAHYGTTSRIIEVTKSFTMLFFSVQHGGRIFNFNASVMNGIVGDPCPGQTKTLTVVYCPPGMLQQNIVCYTENEPNHFPPF